jgi:flagellin FlaB
VKEMMGNIWKTLKEKDVGDIGIGAMIVFIAMVLVAGIAASVLIQTATKLETQVIKTGRETLTEAASGLKIECVEGYNSSGKITKIAVEATSRAGASDIDLSQVVIELSNSTSKYLLRYGGAVTNMTDVNGDLFLISNFGDADDFDIVIMQDADGSVKAGTPIINYGDHVAFAITTSAVFSGAGGISPRVDVFGQVIVEEGAPGIIGFTTPASYTKAVMELQ